MKCRTIALLMLAALLLLPLGASSGTTDPETALESPDGVALWDFTQSSTVWGRTFDFNPPEGVHEKDIFSLCTFEGPGAGAAKWACLEPYIADVRWTAPDTPGAWHIYDIDNPDEGSDPLPELPGLAGPTQLATISTKLEVHGFEIHDNVDPSSKAAEGYVYFKGFTSGGWSVSPATFCQDQGTSLGWCGKAATNTLQIVKIGADSCDGVLAEMEFWDDDGSSGDDIMDISTRLGDAEANIDATLSNQASPCSDEDGLWWSERGNFDSSTDRCHGITLGVPCNLTGQYDASGDNDDASLGFTIYFN